jgi:hypothetical protein
MTAVSIAPIRILQLIHRTPPQSANLHPRINPLTSGFKDVALT